MKTSAIVIAAILSIAPGAASAADNLRFTQAWPDRRFPPQAMPADVLPPQEIFASLSSMGLRPLDQPRLRGDRYILRAIDRRGQEVRVVIDAFDGEVLRTMRVGRFEDGPGREPPPFPNAGPVQRAPESFLNDREVSREPEDDLDDDFDGQVRSVPSNPPPPIFGPRGSDLRPPSRAIAVAPPESTATVTPRINPVKPAPLPRPKPAQQAAVPSPAPLSSPATPATAPAVKPADSKTDTTTIRKIEITKPPQAETQAAPGTPVEDFAH